jgi:colicin import membrane protein
VLFHLAVFSTIFLVPESLPTRRIGGTVYEVNLVEMPTKRAPKAGKEVKSDTGKRVSDSAKITPAKRIGSPKKEEKPVVIAKRTLSAKKLEPEKPKENPSKLIDRAISKIETKVKEEKRTEEKDSIARAISKLETHVKGAEGAGATGGAAGVGVAIQMYRLEVEEKIKGNWSYPVALGDVKDKKGLEAIVVVHVRSDGTILKSRFKTRSSFPLFDQSVLRAVERSDPLPPFPEGYMKTSEEIEINFNLKELEEQ